MGASGEVWGRVRVQTREILLFLPKFLKKPVEGMKSPPAWDWATILLLHGAFGAGTGLIRGFLEFKLGPMIVGSVVAAFSALLIGFIGSGLIALFLLFYFNRREDLLRIYTCVCLASLPLLLLRILGAFESLLPPANLLGFALMCLLLTVSLVEVFRVPQKIVARWMGGVFVFAFIFWVASVISTSREMSDQGHRISPESIEVLKREFERSSAP